MQFFYFIFLSKCITENAMLLLEDIIVLEITECCSGTEIIIHNGKQAFYFKAVRSRIVSKL